MYRAGRKNEGIGRIGNFFLFHLENIMLVLGIKNILQHCSEVSCIVARHPLKSEFTYDFGHVSLNALSEQKSLYNQERHNNNAGLQAYKTAYVSCLLSITFS